MDALLDTGSTLSVLSPQIFEKIPESCKPSITPVESNLRMANSDTSTPQGKACCNITIDNTEFWPQLTIAYQSSHDYLVMTLCMRIIAPLM